MTHQQRIRNELIKAGVTKYGLLKLESRTLHSIIHPDEHVMAAVYGRVESGSAMLIATDMRVLYYDKKPLFSILDELNYDVVSGVSHDKQTRFSHVVLKTRMGDYTIRYGNPHCATTFVNYIEKVRIDKPGSTLADKEYSPHPKPEFVIESQCLRFLQTHDIGVLSSLDRANRPTAAVVYYTITTEGILHFLTKTGTEKSRNITANPAVAFTVYDEPALQTAQIQAKAEVETDQAIREQVYQKLGQVRQYTNGARRPPVTDLHEGSFTIIRLTPTNVKYTDFRK